MSKATILVILIKFMLEWFKVLYMAQTVYLWGQSLLNSMYKAPSKYNPSLISPTMGNWMSFRWDPSEILIIY